MQRAVSERGIVAAPHSLAVETGRMVMADGGNAFEAAVAMAATLAVVYPHMNGIGGDGFWVVRDGKKPPFVVQACGAAGSGATIAAYRGKGYDAVPLRGPDAAATVAGAVSGWASMLEVSRSTGGKVPLRILLEDAVKLAGDGFPASAAQGRCAIDTFAELAAAPGFAAAYLKDGRSLEPGTMLVQARLADTLDQLARSGPRDFYRGDIGREIAADLERIGAPIVRADLARQEATVRKPLALRLKEGVVYTPPPPSQGVTSLLILGIAERLAIARAEESSFVHGLVEAAKRAYALRDAIIGEPAELLPDIAPLLEPRRLEREAGRIDMGAAGPFQARPDEGDTIWLGAIDAAGRAVSYCQSIFFEWGSGCVLPSTGILWHNRAFAFSLDERSPRALEPGRIPFHTLSPAMAELNDGRQLAFGTMGGEGQPQTVATLYSRYVRFGQDLETTLDEPRWRLGRGFGESETSLTMEPRFDPEILARLERLGHPVRLTADAYSDAVGHAGMVVRHPGGRIEGIHDPRADGGAGGP